MPVFQWQGVSPKGAKLKGEVMIVPPGTLPNDGKVISDERTYG